METVFVIYSHQVEGYGIPFKVFKNKLDLEKYLEDNKDQFGREYCYEELEVE